ncbi:MAG TPA: deoxyribonuclease V [Gemmatimonadaceae bacterium]|nr:deoxyribonuclease V [Gemmatimonadaceae bacterium]
MPDEPLDHPWDVSVPEAVSIQRRLRDRVVPHPPLGFAPRLVAGADISLDRGSPRGYAGVVVIDARTMETVDEATAGVELPFPYVPGLLSFRELPAVARAWAGLATRPDVVIFDGSGYNHPRRFGLACHGGVLLDVPSIGCAKSILVGRHGPLADEAGATAPLLDKGEVVGMAVRLRARVAPVYVSIGHKMDLETAVAVVGAMSTGYREPETTRRAHRLVNALRRRAGSRDD